jgi:UDP-N-acetylmuramyl-tripeptide synthetase
MHDTTTKLLTDLLQGIPYSATTGGEGILITGIAVDSRAIKPGYLFIAITGQTADGHAYISEAETRGCAAIVFEKGKAPKDQVIEVAGIEVDDSRAALGTIAANYYDHPASRMKLIGITGTNGKTTTAYLLEAIVKNGGRPGVIGTINYRFTDRRQQNITVEAALTTPEPLTLQRLLRQMADEDVSHVIMEVSSHALAQKRLQGLHFDMAIFTNLTRDHLDFHGDMESYFASKKDLFLRYLTTGGQAVIVLNHSEEASSQSTAETTPDWGRRLGAELAGARTVKETGRQRQPGSSPHAAARITTCSLTGKGEIYPRSFTHTLEGIRAEINTPVGILHLQSPLVGDFNLKNLLAAIGAGLGLGFDCRQIEKSLAAVRGVPGRLERVPSPQGAYIFVDYAHTPDALHNVLVTLKTLQPSRLICVFGCGGDRDVGKRPLMGQTAGRLCDVVIVTSDNPRSEDPQRILEDIEAGLRKTPLHRAAADTILERGDGRGYDLIPSRAAAIEKAVRQVRRGEVLLIAGKGHESYQLIGTNKYFFNDCLEAGKHLSGTSSC